MTDSEALRTLVKGRGLKYKYIAGQLGLSPYGLQRKIDNLSEFKISEITAFSDAVGGLSFAEQKQLFFANFVDNKSTKRVELTASPTQPLPTTQRERRRTPRTVNKQRSASQSSCVEAQSGGG